MDLEVFAARNNLPREEADFYTIFAAIDNTALLYCALLLSLMQNSHAQGCPAGYPTPASLLVCAAAAAANPSDSVPCSAAAAAAAAHVADNAQDGSGEAYSALGFSNGFQPRLPGNKKVNPYLRLLPMLAGIG